MDEGNSSISTHQPGFDYPAANDFIPPDTSPFEPVPYSQHGLDNVPNTANMPDTVVPATSPSALLSPPAAGPSTDSYRCELCPQVRDSKDKLRKHVKQVHDKSHVCTECGHKVGAKEDLNRHLWQKHEEYAEANEIPCKWEECPKCLVEQRSDNMKRHKQSCRP